MPNRILYSLCFSINKGYSDIIPPILTSRASVFPHTSTILSSASLTLFASGQNLIPFFIAQSYAIIDIVAFNIKNYLKYSAATAPHGQLAVMGSDNLHVRCRSKNYYYYL
ncbi:hypothetical protein BpHYR1_015261 [Brachionus plicatilis]|uniref:Uncharacterized protein n=1 Tax=Brachionus plicatilis TaxID=10195 RepID=A0A3M7Q3G1_BRAPC|nr:hypothetical protein BpHYR1_015261 [Brachionus plicatilis]